MTHIPDPKNPREPVLSTSLFLSQLIFSNSALKDRVFYSQIMLPKMLIPALYMFLMLKSSIPLW